MALDTRYVPLFSLQEFFVDNLTAQALGGGIVSFYDDNSQSIPKQVYELVATGTPPSYSYVSLGSQLQLSSYGTFIDANGSDIVPYLFPYDGDAATTTDTLELYYIVVTAASGRPQFVRHAVPNLAGSGGGGGSNPILTNHIPNGQFQLHNSNAPVPGLTAVYGGDRGTVSQTSVAPGGIYYERSSTSTAVDTITFTQNTQYYASSSSSPRYLLNIVRSTVSADGVCGLVFRFMDVNKFTNPNTTPSTQPVLTLLFNAVLGNGTSLSGIGVNQILYYGTGGSATQTIARETGLTLTNVDTQFSTVFANTPNVSAIIGPLNNDFVEFEISFPTNSTFNIQISDVMLLNGSFVGGINPGATLFPQLTNGQFLLEAMSNIAPTIPDPFITNPPYYAQNGDNLFLPMVMTKDGMAYDYGVIGKVEAAIASVPATSSSLAYTNDMPADGGQYLAAGYSYLGIPYSRIGNYFFSKGSNGIPLYGTGLAFSTVFFLDVLSTNLSLFNNRFGTGVAPANGTLSPGFTYANINQNSASGYNVVAHRSGDQFVDIKGQITAFADTGTTGITIGEPRNGYTALTGSYSVFRIGTAAVSISGLAGKYFTFTANSLPYYVWFKYNTGGSDPAPGGTGILINLYTNFSTNDLANILTYALNGGIGTEIIPTSGATIPQNSWFSFTSPNGNQYYVWFDTGTGTIDPAPGGYTLGIKVTYTTSFTDMQVATAIKNAINSTYFRAPLLSGMFLRGKDASGTIDLESTTRYSENGSNYGPQDASFEYDYYLTHTHTASSALTITGGANTSGSTFITTLGSNAAVTATQPGSIITTVQNAGGLEVTPVNAYVNWVIKY